MNAKKTLVMLLLVSIILMQSLCACPALAQKISKDIGSEEPNYSSLDNALNASASDGKLAGEIDMEAPFIDNDSGGLGGEIGATIDAQNEMENKDFLGEDN